MQADGKQLSRCQYRLCKRDVYDLRKPWHQCMGPYRIGEPSPRVNVLQPGTGVGGHCIAVDPWFIVDTAPKEARIIRTAREVNDNKPHWVLKSVKLAIADVLAAEPHRTMDSLRVACLGLAFKPDIDDLRESPAVTITSIIASTGLSGSGR